MSRSSFNSSGLMIGGEDVNMTYLYGLSDFFSVMFEDPEKINLLLESESQNASEIYSRFLQLTSTISLEDIQKTCGHALKLITLKTSDKVIGETNVYNISEDIISSRYIANRPFLPTSLFEENVDYRLEQTSSGVFRIRFAKDISTAGFSTRLLSDGVTKEYALWFVDCELDEKWISTYYGNLIGISPDQSTEAFRNFIYGLYYIYANGPTLDLIRKGLNLTLGIPLARGTETVLEIRKYLETDQYIVVTDSNQYLIPYGLSPIVSVGDTINLSDELTKWVEVKDYINDGEWWINLQIPNNIIPSLPDGQVNRYATKESHFDYLMRTYLKKHTFLVNVKVTAFKDIQFFAQLADIIKKSKPSYTHAIYIWTVSGLDETLTLNDDRLKQRRDQFRCENLSVPIYRMYRGNVNDPLKRGCPTFVRYNISKNVTRLCGLDEYCNGHTDVFDDGTLNGYVNGIGQYRTNTDEERAWIRTMNERGSEIVTGLRSRVGFYRSIHSEDDVVFNYSGSPVHVLHSMCRVPYNMRIIPIYVTTQNDIKNKCNSLGIRVPDMVEWCFDFLNPLSISQEVNALPINEGMLDPQDLLLSNNFNLAFFRGTDVNYLSNVMPDQSFRTWAPPNSSFINKEDYILGVRIYDKVIGMYWVTTNLTIIPNTGLPVVDTDCTVISMQTRTARGLGPTSSPYYLLRGRGYIDYNNISKEINSSAIDENPEVPPVVHNDYADPINISPTPMTRAGSIINHKMELN